MLYLGNEPVTCSAGVLTGIFSVTVLALTSASLYSRLRDVIARVLVSMLSVELQRYCGKLAGTGSAN